MIRFETPDFRNGPDFFTIYLLFTKCGSPCYTEPEPISITIINTIPVIDNPKASEITIYDGLTDTLHFTATDPENSDLLELRMLGVHPTWV